MQARTRTWTERFDPGQIKLFLVAIAAIAILLIGVVLSTTMSSGNDQIATIDRARSEAVRPTSNARFLSWNVLPGDPGTYPVTSQREYRFLDWNILSGDPGTVPVTSLQEHRFQDWNILPDDHGAFPATSLQEYRFRDWNTLPGDDTPFIPPAYEHGTRH